MLDTIVVVAIIAAVAVMAGRSFFRTMNGKNKGGGCSGGCHSCARKDSSMNAVRHILSLLFCLTLWNLAFIAVAPARADDVATDFQDQPGKIRDNLFLLEEAYNQEPGVIQHIQFFSLNPRTRGWNYSFTEEWPAPTDRHQLSLTVPLTDQGKFGSSGFGDISLNYRLQAIGAGGGGRFAMAPRVSLVLPTGKYQTGNGRGSAGLQINLPVSMEIGNRFVTHLNAGLTATPRARSSFGYSASTIDTNAGVALVWLPLTLANPLVEIVYLTTQEIRNDRSRPRSSTAIVNPGIRFAINCRSGLQIVPGISAPIQFDNNRTSASVMFYLSFEHPLRRQR
jgi:hypothetical protein